MSATWQSIAGATLQPREDRPTTIPGSALARQGPALPKRQRPTGTGQRPGRSPAGGGIDGPCHRQPDLATAFWPWPCHHALELRPAGRTPVPPRLLDDLAYRFIHNGWSLKWLHRELVLSSTYRKLSRSDGVGQATDPDNRWLWGNEPPTVVDRIVAGCHADGQWRTRHVPGWSRPDRRRSPHRRRTLYSTIKRRELDTMLRLYDFPSPTGHSPKRIRTITPLQQLFVLNSPFIVRQAN
ncbi:MAG: hypothetical protein CM1200mP2_59610 [Planctomycetaceae bacterium]|nr:MAG: hypothetical protein CM1200mP2_59610 [Planctomycetaceae bacterium]